MARYTTLPPNQVNKAGRREVKGSIREGRGEQGERGQFKCTGLHNN